MSNHSIHSLIHQNLKRMLGITLGVSAVILFAYTLFSLKQTENQAERFVTNHVERLAEAGVTSQSVSEVDLEIARFAQTWKETEDTDLRIDIFLNDRQISHAGQLQPFLKTFSTLTERELKLPSGDALKVKIQIDLSGVIFYGLLLLIGLESAIFGLFYILRRSIQVSIKEVTGPLESKIKWLQEIAKDLPSSARKSMPFEPSQIAEIDNLGESIQILTKEIVVLEDNLANANYDRGRLKMAEQVAHSIKGVIATLQLKIGNLPVESEAERAGLRDCIETLSGISGNLLKSKKTSLESKVSDKSAESIHALPAILSAFSSKKDQYQNNPKIMIEMQGDNSIKGFFTTLTVADIQSILFNLIDNGVESLSPSGGKVDINLYADDHSLFISVCDNGHGIPKQIVPSLMVEGFSYGKIDGNGLGLFHAKDISENAGGEISLTSLEGHGTTVTIKIPLALPSHSDVRTISFSNQATVVCVDDDLIIHQVWDTRLNEAKVNKSNIVHLYSVSDFETWISKNGVGEYGSRFYLFDFDLKDKNKNGIDLIEEYGVAFESILVTGMAGTEIVRSRTKKIGVKQVSKEHIGSIAIRVNEMAI